MPSLQSRLEKLHLSQSKSSPFLVRGASFPSFLDLDLVSKGTKKGSWLLRRSPALAFALAQYEDETHFLLITLYIFKGLSCQKWPTGNQSTRTYRKVGPIRTETSRPIIGASYSIQKDSRCIKWKTRPRPFFVLYSNSKHRKKLAESKDKGSRKSWVTNKGA